MSLVAVFVMCLVRLSIYLTVDAHVFDRLVRMSVADVDELNVKLYSFAALCIVPFPRGSE